MAEDRTQLVVETSSEAGSDAGLTQTLEQLLDLQREAKQLEDDLDKLAAGANEADGEFGQLGGALAGTSEDAQRFAKRLNDMDRKLGTAATGVKALRNNLADLRGKLNASGAKAFSGAIDAAKQSLIGFQRRIGELALETMVAGIKAGAVAIADFDQAMARVQTNTGATGNAFKNLEQLARDLGATTDRTANEIASGFFEMSKAGFSATEIIASGESAVRLAQVAFIDMGEAAGRAATEVRAFGAEAGDLRVLVDQAAAGASSANLSFAEMDEALLRVAPSAVLVNKALKEQAKSATDVQKELIPLVQVLADAGIRGAKAGEGIDRLIRRLQALSDGSDRGKQELDRLGLSFDDVNPAVVGITQALENLAAAQIDPQTGFRLVGDEAARVFNVLTEGVGKLRENAAAMEDTEGAATRLAAGYQDNLRGAYDGMISAATELALVFGDTSGTDAARTSLQILTDGLRENEEVVRALGVVFGSLAAAINTIAAALVTGFTVAIDAAGVAIQAFGALIGAQMEASAQAVKIFNQEMGEDLEAAGEAMRELSQDKMAEGARDIERSSRKGLEALKQVWGEDVPAIFGATGEAAVEAAQKVDGVAGAAESAAAATGSTTTANESAAESFKRVTEAVTGASEAMKIPGAAEGIAAMITAQGAAEGAGEAATAAGEGFADAAEGAGDAAGELQDAAQAAEGAASGQEAIATQASAAAESVGGLVELISSLGGADVSGLQIQFNGLATAVASVRDQVQGLDRDLASAAKSAWELAKASEAAAPSEGAPAGVGGEG